MSPKSTKDLQRIASHNIRMSKASKMVASAITALTTTICTATTVFAAEGDGDSGIAEGSAISKLGSIMGSLFKEIFSTIVLVSTLIAAGIVAVCMVIRMVSKNQRSVDEANQWIKRVLITWVCLNGISLFITLAAQVSEGMGGTSEVK